MTIFKLYAAPADKLYQCQTCGKIITYKRIKDKLKEHANKHDSIVVIQ